MKEARELAALLAAWPEASEQVESAPSEACLTTAEISDFVDDQLPASARDRAAMHLSQCSFCAREVGALYQAARDFDDRIRVKSALGKLTSRLSACVHVFVDEARGAFTRADALLQGLSAPVQLRPVTAPAGLALMGARGGGDDAEDEESDPDALHEATLFSEELHAVDLFCTEEDDGGSVTISLEEPFEVCLVAPDGSSRALEVQKGEDRYYAMISGIPPGDYLLALIRPEEGAPDA